MSKDTLNVSPSQSIIAKLGFFKYPAVLLSCEQSYRKLITINDMTLAEAFRKSWTCQPLKQKRTPQYAICHVKGIIKKIYKDLNWYPASLDKLYQLGHSTGLIVEIASRHGDVLQNEMLKEVLERVKNTAMQHEQSDLWNFTGNEAPEHDHLLGVSLTAELTQRGMANPVRYINCA